jgi:hypothetical protein
MILVRSPKITRINILKLILNLHMPLSIKLPQEVYTLCIQYVECLHDCVVKSLKMG